MGNNIFQNIKVITKPALIFVLIMWLVFLIEQLFHLRLNRYGILPRNLSGLIGVITSPFLHGGLSHIWNNTLPSFFLITALRAFYKKEAFRIFFLGMLLTGLLTWFIGRTSYHIGASGIIYMLASFLIFKGLFTKRFKLVALSFVILFFYGSLVWYVFPIVKGMSWEGHLSGLLSGLALALVVPVQSAPNKKYPWESVNYKTEDDPFMRQFDSQGNFIELNEEE